MHQQRPNAHVHRQSGPRVRHDQARAHVHARAGLGVPAVVPQPGLDARRQRQPPGERVGPRAFQARPEAGDRRVGRLQAPRRPVHPVDGRADPQRVGLERQPEAARAPGQQLAPRPRRRHRHRQARLERLPAVRRQQQPAGPVAGHAPDRHALGHLVAQPRVEARHRRRHLAAGGAGVLAQTPAVRQRQPRHPPAPERSRPRTWSCAPRRRATARPRAPRSATARRGSRTRGCRRDSRGSWRSPSRSAGRRRRGPSAGSRRRAAPTGRPPDPRPAAQRRPSRPRRAPASATTRRRRPSRPRRTSGHRRPSSARRLRRARASPSVPRPRPANRPSLCGRPCPPDARRTPHRAGAGS